jgi:hypothetical protein
MIKNEWLVMYTDEYGYDMIMPFNTYEMALHFAQIVPVLRGVCRTAWYNDTVENVGFEFGTLI